MKQILITIYYSFQVQLLILHLKRHQFLLFFWVLLFLVVSNSFGNEFGIPYLFLDPEYLGKVNFTSFFLLGAGFGGFTMTWNISTYILNSHRFPFLATFRKPFTMFCMNNSLLPLGFLITYCILLYNFQSNREFVIDQAIAYDILGIVSGFLSAVLVIVTYFATTNTNIFALLAKPIIQVKRIQKRVMTKEKMLWEDFRDKEDEYRVDVYLTPNFRVRHIRSVKHYDDNDIKRVFSQNHSNALLFLIINFITLLVLGFFIDIPIFQLPAAASAMIAVSMAVSMSGMFGYWFGKWQVVYFILFLVGFNFLVKNRLITHDNQAFGLSYQVEPEPYHPDRLIQLANPSQVEDDRKHTIKFLENWKKRTGEEKPKIVFLNFSGGGVSSALYSTAILQLADSLSGGKLMRNTVLMCGASGGMLGAAYYRELTLQKELGNINSTYDGVYRENISKDLLNPMIVSGVVNDFFYPWRKFEVSGQLYAKDRAYAMERQLMVNTDSIMDKNLGEYAPFVFKGIIPMMVFTPTIMNDERKLYITSQPVSYLMRPYNYKLQTDYMDVDGVDMRAMFKDHQPDSLLITSAMRMNATYPYVLPNVTLPSVPVMRVMDAGLRDNYGIETTTKFINVFKDWIKENTSGVIVVQVRAFEKDRQIKSYETESLLDRFFNPIASVYTNMGPRQDYLHNQLISSANQLVDNKLSIVNLTYVPDRVESKTSLSFRLTGKEKQDIIATARSKRITERLIRLKQLLEED